MQLKYILCITILKDTNINTLFRKKLVSAQVNRYQLQ